MGASGAIFLPKNQPFCPPPLEAQNPARSFVEGTPDEKQHREPADRDERPQGAVGFP